GLVLLMSIAGEVLGHARRQPDALYYIFGSGVVAVLSLAGITLPIHGPGGITAPAPAMVVYAIYGAGCLVLNLRWRRPLASSLGLALLVVATLWLLWWRFPAQTPLWGAVLAGEALAMGILGALLGHPDRQRPLVPAFGEPLARSAEAVAVVALLVAVWSGVTT